MKLKSWPAIIKDKVKAKHCRPDPVFERSGPVNNPLQHLSGMPCVEM